MDIFTLMNSVLDLAFIYWFLTKLVGLCCQNIITKLSFDFSKGRVDFFVDFAGMEIEFARSL